MNRRVLLIVLVAGFIINLWNLAEDSWSWQARLLSGVLATASLVWIIVILRRKPIG